MKPQTTQLHIDQTEVCTAVMHRPGSPEGLCAFKTNQKWVLQQTAQLQSEGKVIDETDMDKASKACTLFARNKNIECTSQKTASIYYHSAPAEPTNVTPHRR